MARCICIDDSNRPKQIPQEKWVVYGNQYTIIDLKKMVLMGEGVLGVRLDEIDLDESNAPYELFLASRFAIFKDDMELLNAIAEGNKELQEVYENERVYVYS